MRRREWPYSSCTLGRFTYALDGALDFSAGWSAHDEFFASWYGGVTSGGGSFYNRSDRIGQEDNHFLWTDATTFSIAPVPEPAGAAMMLAGAALLATAQVRARRRLPG